MGHGRLLRITAYLLSTKEPRDQKGLGLVVTNQYGEDLRREVCLQIERQKGQRMSRSKQGFALQSHTNAVMPVHCCPKKSPVPRSSR